MYLQRQAHQEVADAFAVSIPQNLKALFTGTNVIAELLPLLNRVVAPDLKPVRLRDQKRPYEKSYAYMSRARLGIPRSTASLSRATRKRAWLDSSAP